MRKQPTYRAARRNNARAQNIRFPWRAAEALGKVRRIERGPVRANKCHKTAEERAKPPEPAMNFVGSIVGLSLAFRAVPKIVQLPKASSPKPPKEFYSMPPDKLKAARMRHPWWRKAQARGQLTNEPRNV